jgi:hypothetical protein
LVLVVVSANVDVPKAKLRPTTIAASFVLELTDILLDVDDLLGITPLTPMQNDRRLQPKRQLRPGCRNERWQRQYGKQGSVTNR